ncbi:unnamed protein product [Phytophthora fragariaefolia]|uniref:Unnamed protein product n=1 Tax=Phytophthora fragariaefolia TaxID=1490495 RepID=A0A9W6XHV4_9STRA|nr:unnamed protein product [Phytophthora fragariaefolia]
MGEQHKREVRHTIRTRRRNFGWRRVIHPILAASDLTTMGAAKPSKKQRGKLKASKNKKEAAKTHVKFDDNGDKVVPKKRARAVKKKDAEEVKEGGGKTDRSPEMIQQAKYYLEQWQKRDEPKADDELPWKFKVRCQLLLIARLSIGKSWNQCHDSRLMSVNICVIVFDHVENSAAVDPSVDVRGRCRAQSHVCYRAGVSQWYPGCCSNGKWRHRDTFVSIFGAELRCLWFSICSV